MKIKIDKEGFANAIQIVQNIVSTKSALPILANMLLVAQDNSLKLIATDLDVGISCVIPVETQESGAITVPAKRFGDIIRELPGDSAVITSKKNNMITIETESCQFKIMGLPAEEFPKLPEFKDREIIKLEQSVLKEMLHLTSFAASTDESRYVLNGILLNIQNNNLVLVATDGKRLAITNKKLSNPIDKDVNIIVPIKTVQELNRNLQEEGELSLVIGQNQVLFDLGNIVIISRLIEGEFPDYRQVIPPVSEYKMRINREEFLLAIKRASLLTTPDYQAVKLEVFKDKLVVSKSTPDIGESSEIVPMEYKGKEVAIGFNSNYLIDVLKNLDSELIDLELMDGEKPGVIRSDRYVYIVLPMRLS
jgi:DNA polymerase-3 subunit beta